MRAIPFYKMEASGNDFVVMDARKRKLPDLKKLTRAVCDRHLGIGADGLLLLENSRKADFRMRIVNADGSEAEMCGNGSRCLGLFAHQVLKFPAQASMETLAGVIGLKIKQGQVTVRLSDPKDFKDRFTLPVDGKNFAVYFINTGVPHAVIMVDDLHTFPVESMGEKIRYHKAFAPAGTNVNFVQVISRKKIRVRTYERGVGETQACGTGMSAAAVISVLAGKCEKPVTVQPKDGRLVTIDFQQSGNKITDVTLRGAARFVYQGLYSVK